MKLQSLTVVLLSIASLAFGATTPQVPIEGSAIPQFTQPLPQLNGQPHGTMTVAAGSRPLTLRMCEFRASMLPRNAVPDYHGTWVWGYLVDTSGNSTCSQLVNYYYGGTDHMVDTYVGPVIVNERGKPTEVRYVNDLGDTSHTNVLFYKYSTDQTIHWADPLRLREYANPCTEEADIPAPGTPCAENYSGPIPAVAHLHGGEVPPEIDGGPDAWFTSDGAHHGNRYYSSKATSADASIYRYPNTQEAAPIWFHDHTLGATRLNVYAGLAGAYLIYDPAQQLPSNLQPLTEVIPLVIQDRMFDQQGQLYFPADSANGELVTPNPNHPYWVPEFMGDTIVVNGKAWPYLDVEPKRYRFLLLNGSNARPYQLFLQNSRFERGHVPSFWVIGTDGGYLDAPTSVAGRNMRRRLLRQVSSDGLVILPGERYEIIIDFAGLPAGTRLVMRNTASAPYPDGEPVDDETTGRVMEFRVGSCSSGACGRDDQTYNPASGTPIRTGSQRIVRLVDPWRGTLASSVTPDVTRELTLNEVLGPETTAIDPVTGELEHYEGGPLEILVNNSEWMGETWRSYGDFTVINVNGVSTGFSELPQEGTTELWEIVNLTADAHPIHLHLAQFQLMNRQAFDLEAYEQVYTQAFPGGVFAQGFGPPLDYRADHNAQSAGKLGGNPDVSPYLGGSVRPPLAYEAGWKDTVIAYPREVTRLVVRWAPPHVPVDAPQQERVFAFDPNGEGGRFAYVWHCHIIDHEDNEMMRPSLIVPNPQAPPRQLKKGVDY